VLPEPAQKAVAVRAMFGAIAPRYDLLNHLLSLNMDRRWRRIAVTRLLDGGREDGVYLDACAGTLDLAAEIVSREGFRGRVVAADFALPMLARGAAKVTDAPVLAVCADATRLPLADGSVDGAIVGFGIRNVEPLDAGLAELARVTRRNGRLVLLEFTTPTRQPLRSVYLFYFRRVLPRLGRLLSRHDTAYDYLPASVLEFPAPAQLAARVSAAGFEEVRWRRLAGGIVAVHEAVRG